MHPNHNPAQKAGGKLYMRFDSLDVERDARGDYWLVFGWKGREWARQHVGPIAFEDGALLSMRHIQGRMPVNQANT